MIIAPSAFKHSKELVVRRTSGVLDDPKSHLIIGPSRKDAKNLQRHSVYFNRHCLLAQTFPLYYVSTHKHTHTHTHKASMQTRLNQFMLVKQISPSTRAYSAGSTAATVVSLREASEPVAMTIWLRAPVEGSFCSTTTARHSGATASSAPATACCRGPAPPIGGTRAPTRQPQICCSCAALPDTIGNVAAARCRRKRRLTQPRRRTADDFRTPVGSTRPAHIDTAEPETGR